MKTIEEKAEAYDKAIKVIKDNLGALNEIVETGAEVVNIQSIQNCFYKAFPELKESNDERIRKEILNYIDKATGCKRWVVWLEKQEDKDSQVKLPTFTFDDILALECCMETVKKVQEDKDLYEKLNDLHGRVYDAYHLEKQCEQNHCMIQWKGDNLKEVIDFTGKDKNFEKWFKSFEEYEKYVQEHDGIFKLFNADGSHYEVPVGAWIVKTPDGYNVASKAIFRQKPVDKVEPKFKVGDWVIDKQGIVHQVANVVENVTNHTYGYDIVGGGYFNDTVEGVRLWNISDANDGDILHSTGFHNDCIFIFNGLDNWKFDEPNGDRAVATGYCCLSVSADNMEFGMQGPDCVDVSTVKPATKIQRDLLFRKIKEAGYKWDAEKKELKKIEHKPTWSDEDESNFQGIIDELKANKHHAPDSDLPTYDRFLSWFKSLKGRYVWKPSNEQMEILSIYKNVNDVLASLYQDLKKLKG